MEPQAKNIPYDVKIETLVFSGTELAIRRLESLDRTIDQVFEFLEQSGRPELLEELCPYFGVIWPSAIALAEAVAELQPEAHPPLLEIGCGLAIPSMVAVKKGFSVTATDFHPEVRRFLEQNIAMNGLSGLQYEHVDWRTADFDGKRFDWIIGSDILYERNHPEWVAQTINRLLSPKGHAIIADPARPYLQEFADAMKTYGFTHETAVRRVSHEGKPRDIFVLRIARSQ